LLNHQKEKKMSKTIKQIKTQNEKSKDIKEEKSCCNSTCCSSNDKK